MSGIAGIVYFDGRPVDPGQVESMTAAMHLRGPDGIQHWRRGNVAVGQCMLRTTPESLEEVQPLTNEDASVVLVMDGRVDNFEDLRRELLAKGALLRTRADAELVLRAYEVWGEECPQRVIGEYAFFVWDARQQRFFGARDAAGTRHFYYHQGKDWFAFASEIKGLLALPQIERRLEESRLLDYLVPEFDRTNEVLTFYRGISRMPAGHSMTATAARTNAIRWWQPGELTEQKFSSLEECTEAFMHQLRIALKCRLRSIKPVGAMLSGGLDSSSIVGLISKEFGDQLREPLRTFSLIREDRENCPDWHSINAILQADPWLHSTIIDSSKIDDAWPSIIASVPKSDEPFEWSHGLPYNLLYEAAGSANCGVLLDGMAGDLMFYSPERTAFDLARTHRYNCLPRATLSAYLHHGTGGGLKSAARAILGNVTPAHVVGWARRRRDELAVGKGDLKMLLPSIATPYLKSKRPLGYYAGKKSRATTEQDEHAKYFTTGLLSFGHETYGPHALNIGVDPRSPFSDRRVIEFAVRMPLEAKVALPRYKQLLRNGTTGILPNSVRLRTNMGGHPGWNFYERLRTNLAKCIPSAFSAGPTAETLQNWLVPSIVGAQWELYRLERQTNAGDVVLRQFILSMWLLGHDLNTSV
ncbi:MAG: asparagine synthase-related protein [Pseudomonadota bacterium]